MKLKTIASLFLKGICFSMVLLLAKMPGAHAQFNTTYTYTLAGVKHNTFPTDLVPSGKGTYWVLAQTDSILSGDGTVQKYLILKKMDVTGATLFDKMYAYDYDTTTFFSATKMVQTTDSGFIVVGYLHDHKIAFKNANPYAAKFDKTGAFLWMQVYNSNPKTSSSDDAHIPNFVRPNIVKVQGMTGEHYIITCTGFADSTLPANLDESYFVNALEIDGSGNLIWNKKYEISNGDSAAIYQISPSALTFATMNGQSNSYFISGSSSEYYPNGDQANYLFTFGIDNNGNVIHNYTQYRIIDYVFGVCATFDADPSRQSILVSYTVGDQGVVSGVSTSSVIGLAQFNSVTYGMASNNFYYMANTDHEEYCNTITKTIQDGNYLISTWAAHINPGTPYGLLKINAVSKAPIFWEQYNTVGNGFNTFGISLLNSTGTVESYIQASARPYPTTASGIKVLGTNVAGSTCGAASFSPLNIAASYLPTSYTDSIVSYTGQLSPTLKAVVPSVSDTLCAGDPNYRGTDPENITPLDVSINDIEIYPTLLEQGNNVITLKVASSNDTHISAVLYSISGIKITQKIFDITQGSSNLQWTLPVSKDGNYILKVISEDGAIQKNIRITKL